ncbi:MAG: hypothetical protein MZV70_60675 [Desulfobacterales bacterium]|nr:hypothetical protein [Desulfobacterales bacterium]
MTCSSAGSAFDGPLAGRLPRSRWSTVTLLDAHGRLPVGGEISMASAAASTSTGALQYQRAAGRDSSRRLNGSIEAIVAEDGTILQSTSLRQDFLPDQSHRNLSRQAPRPYAARGWTTSASTAHHRIQGRARS